MQKAIPLEASTASCSAAVQLSTCRRFASLTTLPVLVYVRKTPEPVVVLAAGGVGLLINR